VGRETKVGLLVGVVFIGLFGLILGGRAGTAAQEHAPLPVGESEGHRTQAAAIGRTIDPFGGDGSLEMPGADTTTVSDVPETGDEPLIAPEALPFDEGDPDAPAEPADTGDIGLVVFLPETVTTPMGGRSEEDGGDEVVEPPAPEAPVEPAPRPVHTVHRGENLTRIARHHYGKDGERLWRRIWEANKDSLPDPHRLAEGQELVIPRLPVQRRPVAPVTDVADAPDQAPAEVPESERVPTVTADDLAQMLGNESDLNEHQVDPPATYTIRKGDTFYRIATNLYGNGRLARLLVLKNKHLVPDETKLGIGQRILLLDGVEADLSPESRVVQR
jgi:nucleoid-associated protein YgaU